MKNKIYYVIPDIHKRTFSFVECIRAIRGRRLKTYLDRSVFAKHRPVGGIKVMYQHVLLLRELGYEAELVRMGDYSGNFFGYNIEPIHYDDVRNSLKSEDLVVLPEFSPYLRNYFKTSVNICFVQSWNAMYRDFDNDDQDKSYADLGYDHVICCSDFLKDNLVREPKDRVVLINNYIDLDNFLPDSSARIPNRILGLPRKNPQDIEQIIESANQKENCVLIDGVSQKEMIHAYQRSDIFLATGYPEGFGLPPLEAMACGAVVIGFTGGGASEYMIHNTTALIAEDGDCQQVAEYLVKILQDPKLKERLRKNGLKAAAKYNVQRSKQQLKEFYQSFQAIT